MLKIIEDVIFHIVIAFTYVILIALAIQLWLASVIVTNFDVSHKFTSIRKAFSRYRFHTQRRCMCFLLVLAMHQLYTVPSGSEYALVDGHSMQLHAPY